MFKRNCIVKYVDNFGVEHAKVEAESLFEDAIRGLYRLDSSFRAEDGIFDRMCITVEVHEEPKRLRISIRFLPNSRASTDHAPGPALPGLPREPLADNERSGRPVDRR
jgi:hypothetical protein